MTAVPERRAVIRPDTPTPLRDRALGAAAALFGLATLAASSGVLFGPASARALAGDIVPFVVWFNFLAGFAYLAAAAGLWRARRWGHRLALAIALATLGAGAAFAWVALAGAPVEPRTGAALGFRFAGWAGIAALSAPGRRP